MDRDQKYTDKAGRDYWDECWRDSDVPDAFDPADRRINNHIVQRLDRFFREIVLDKEPRGDPANTTIIEAGCGASRWLPYFAREFGLKIYGVDYSEVGCQKTQDILARSGIMGEIRQADLFDLPNDLHGRFDIVFSNGLVEHFAPTESVVAQLAALSRPGGKVITIIPNLTHLIGWLQKHIDRRVYEVHVPLTLEQLCQAHRACGLEVLSSCHIGTVNWSVLNFSRYRGRWWCPAAIRLAAWSTKIVWLAERWGLPELSNRVTSPYLACVARKI